MNLMIFFTSLWLFLIVSFVAIKKYLNWRLIKKIKKLDASGLTAVQIAYVLEITPDEVRAKLAHDRVKHLAHEKNQPG